MYKVIKDQPHLYTGCASCKRLMVLSAAGGCGGLSVTNIWGASGGRCCRTPNHNQHLGSSLPQAVQARPGIYIFGMW